MHRKRPARDHPRQLSERRPSRPSHQCGSASRISAHPFRIFTLIAAPLFARPTPPHLAKSDVSSVAACRRLRCFRAPNVRPHLYRQMHVRSYPGAAIARSVTPGTPWNTRSNNVLPDAVNAIRARRRCWRSSLDLNQTERAPDRRLEFRRIPAPQPVRPARYDQKSLKQEAALRQSLVGLRRQRTQTRYRRFFH